MKTYLTSLGEEETMERKRFRIRVNAIRLDFHVETSLY